MPTDINNRKDVEQRLWKEIEHQRTGMLGLVGRPEVSHFQPMTAFAEPQSGRIWFFTRADTDLVQDLGREGQAMFVFQQKDVQACLGGRLSVDNDRARIDKYWNSVVAAWYPQGRDDPLLALIRLDLADGQVWISDAGPLKFAWEIARANATGDQPDVGGRANLNFH
jgi:general stress protein 26